MQSARQVDQSKTCNGVSSLNTHVIDDDNTALLVSVATHGDRCAFEQLFERFAKRIYGLGLKISRNEQLAKDVVQDVMLYVWQNANMFNSDRGTAKSWIFTLARNKCIDAIRRAKRHPVASCSDNIWPDHLQDSEIPGLRMREEATAAIEVDVATISKLSAALPSPQCEAIQMIYERDHTHEEAARILDIPLGTFKSRLRLGMIKLKEMVQDPHV